MSDKPIDGWVLGELLRKFFDAPEPILDLKKPDLGLNIKKVDGYVLELYPGYENDLVGYVTHRRHDREAYYGFTIDRDILRMARNDAATKNVVESFVQSQYNIAIPAIEDFLVKEGAV